MQRCECVNDRLTIAWPLQGLDIPKAVHLNSRDRASNNSMLLKSICSKTTDCKEML